MADTFSQIHIQVVFAVKGRQNLLLPQWRKDLFEYMAGIIRSKEQKSIIINGVEDHVHLFLGLRPSMCLSDLIRDVKQFSSSYVNDRRLIRGKFQWQEGYGAFSYSKSQVERVYQYILRQEEHHKKKSFRQEYMEFLKKFDIPFEEKYLFEWIE